jgi:hypothetical protein
MKNLDKIGRQIEEKEGTENRCKKKSMGCDTEN